MNSFSVGLSLSIIIVNRDEPDAFFQEDYIGIETDLNIISSHSGHILDQDRLHISGFDFF